MEIIVETYVPHGEASSAELRVRPLPGQGLDPRLNVACSRSMRKQYPIGSLLRLTVKITYREGTPYLHASNASPVERVSIDEAKRFISVMFGPRPTETSSDEHNNDGTSDL
ncbi:hypothetical protein DR64_2388 [Paraburkholderia xenovorans LB400]|uniref:hypothetical protein n=1 Tax=Paraburkholderia xenovorans TaxID=36873 RepID=UPI0004F8D3D8|nr:hypothetical protein [Paraburkholderia xenovorans]AIP32724.1 hypothetical protein DR64_2388 [Paraburkholderia xenovorans LB400]